MKHLFLLVFFVVQVLPSCKLNNHSDKIKVKMVFEVIHEHLDQNIYYVSWQDTLGKSEGYLRNKVYKRPTEVWCVITNKNNDTLGYYKGLSTAQTFAYFQTSDSVVIFNFMTGPNLFSDKVKDERSALKMQKQEAIIFEPITINLKTSFGKRFEMEIKEK